MNVLLAALQVHTPEALKRRKLEQLFAATADAFGCEAPPISGLSYDALLLRYAEFTREQVEQALREERDIDVIQQRLYDNAFQLGSNLRRLLRIRTFSQAMAAARALYRAIGIDFRGSAGGEVLISSCFFSQIYSSQVCRVISSLDSGVIAGLVGQGQLTFTQRITEGCDHCRAHFHETEAPL